MMIGIDFGTTTSSVAIWRATGAEMIETVDDADFMPSAVAETESGAFVTGRPAIHQMRRNPEYTFRNVKRFLGREWDEQEHGHFQLAEGLDGMVWWRGRGRLISGPELVAEVLKSLLLAAEVRLGKRATGAVIAVPVDFHEAQKQAIREAAGLAGLRRVELFQEPYCAALAYSAGQRKFSRVLVYDFGGGTFDATVLKIKDGDTEAVGMSGSAQVGGADFDQRLADYAVEKFFEREGEDLRAHQVQMIGVLRAAEDAKKILSREEVADIEEANVAFPKSGLISLRETVTRSEFELMTADLVTRTIASVQDALTMAGMKTTEIDTVLLVGGQSRMPLIRGLLEDMFGRKKVIRDGPKAENAVALGAAHRAAEIDGRAKPSVMQVLMPTSIGIRVMGSVYHPVIRKGATYPVRRERTLRGAMEDQEQIEVIVLQGDAEVWHENTEVCRFLLDCDAETRAAIALDVDADGRLSVWADGRVVYGELEVAA